MESELATLWAIIRRLWGSGLADMFTPDLLKLLWDHYYWNEVTLKSANRQSLLDLHMPYGLIDALTNSEDAGEGTGHPAGGRDCLHKHNRACRVVPGSIAADIPSVCMLKCCSSSSLLQSTSGACWSARSCIQLSMLSRHHGGHQARTCMKGLC